MIIRMTILELIKKILGIKRPEPAAISPDEILSEIITDALSLNLKYAAGEDVKPGVVRVKPELLAKELNSSKKGYMALTYSNDETPCSQFIIPGDAPGKLPGLMKSLYSDPSGGEEGPINLFIDRAEGSLYRMFLPGQGEGAMCLRVKRELGLDDAEAVMWGVSECVILQAESDGFRAYIAVPQGIWNSLIRGVNDRDFEWRLRSIAVTEYTGEDCNRAEPGTASINIIRPREFLLGRFFLPVLLKADGNVLSSMFKKISSGEELPGAEYFRVSLDIKVNDAIYRTWYFFEGCNLNTFNERFADFDSLFKPLLRATLAALKGACPGLKVSGIRYSTSPVPEAVPDAVDLHSELKINFMPVNTIVSVPAAFINLIALHALSAWELNLLQSTSRNRILSVLSVNSALFSRGIGSFLDSLRGGGVNLPSALTCMPFYEFMELIGDSDLRIVAQNFILPLFASTYMRLFAVGVPDHSEAGAVRYGIYSVDSDWTRIRLMITVTVR